MHKFYIKKPADTAGTLKSVEKDIKKEGGKFSGSEQSGSFGNPEGNVTCSYITRTNDIEITITKKPFIYPNSAVEAKIREYFAKYI